MNIHRSGVFCMGLCCAALAGQVWAGPHAHGSATSPSIQHEHAGHEHPHAHDAPSDHLTVLGDVRMLHAWTAATRGEIAWVFVEIENRGHEVITLSGGETEYADSVDLVGFRLTAGTPGYQPLSHIEIAPGSTLELAPRAALRLSGLSAPLRQGAHFPLQLHFDHGHAQVMVQVEPAGATQHSHAGHSH